MHKVSLSQVEQLWLNGYTGGDWKVIEDLIHYVSPWCPGPGGAVVLWGQHHSRVKQPQDRVEVGFKQDKYTALPLLCNVFRKYQFWRWDLLLSIKSHISFSQISNRSLNELKYILSSWPHSKIQPRRQDAKCWGGWQHPYLCWYDHLWGHMWKPGRKYAKNIAFVIRWYIVWLSGERGTARKLVNYRIITRNTYSNGCLF